MQKIQAEKETIAELDAEVITSVTLLAVFHNISYLFHSIKVLAASITSIAIFHSFYELILCSLYDYLSVSVNSLMHFSQYYLQIHSMEQNIRKQHKNMGG